MDLKRDKSRALSKDSLISELGGVGSKRAELYAKIGINTIGNLLEYYPRSYIDCSLPVPIQTAEVNSHCVVKGIVTRKIPAARIRQGLTLYKVIVQDESEAMTVVLYNNQYVFDAFLSGEEYIFYGKMNGGFTRKEMNSPFFIRADEPKKIRPVYRLTEGLTSNMLISNLSVSLGAVESGFFSEPLPEALRSYYKLPTREYAIRNVHFPEDGEASKLALRRLAFDELLILQIGMAMLKNRSRQLTSYQMQSKNKALEKFCSSLPFDLTNAQKQAIAEVSADLQSQEPMNRLLQGDVGSGKTVVAAAAAVMAKENGYQTALMAPTEILARQHDKTLAELLTPFGARVCCVTGAVKGKARLTLNEKIQNGEYDVIVGTHALISGSTEFSNLGLVIMDEQHRFGVNQRAALSEKGGSPHKLVMSATPIPRTLALIIYGDLDLTVLNELPKGRQAIETHAITAKLRDRTYSFIKKQLDAGRQAYIICPVIEENENELTSAKAYIERLKKSALGEYNAGLLHGKMSASEKDRVMNDFKEKKLDLLVATTVVEVGVDVPNATVILIENADRFGLSQLHQLRGRVGRSEHKSYCILIAGSVTESAKERLRIMTQTSDGFKISEYDLKLRGAGDFFGERQHGLPSLKVADIAADRVILAETAQAAKKLIKNSPDLSLYPELKRLAEEMFDKGKAGAD
ncbi:MAG: ATP-dependent DNA helicase RecG [Oscillospiraceae bacterium]|nr:ATP-dependent DNA helicase RecG [Oscillospiraceae bacterium]